MKKSTTMQWIIFIFIVVFGVIVIKEIGGRIYFAIANLDVKAVRSEDVVTGSWSGVQNAYKRRINLIKKFAETANEYSGDEKGTFKELTQACSNADSVANMKVEDLTQENLAKFRKAQSGITLALGRFLMTVQQNPDINHSENFNRLQAELAKAEMQIGSEIENFNKAIDLYNKAIRSFPAVLVAEKHGFTKKYHFDTAR